MSTSHIFNFLDSSTDTVSLAMARKWLHQQTTSVHQIESGSTHSTFVPSESHVSDSHESKREQTVTILENTPLHDAKFNFITALRWSNVNDTTRCKKSMKSAFNNCLLAASKHSNTLASCDKILMYSLLISCGFIYYSECGSDYINGLHKIYQILCDMNKEKQLKKDLITALQSKLYWTDTERKLIHASIHFAVRTNLFIQDIQDLIANRIVLNSDEDAKERDVAFNCKLQQYLDIGWVPRYFDGYYFGKMTQNACKYAKLSTKDFRNVMNVYRAPYRIFIDDLVIHTHDLGATGAYIEGHSGCMHHWLSTMDWIDFECVGKFIIYVHVVNNGRVHPLECNLYDTIKSVKHSIHKKENIPMVMMRVEYNNQSLQDNHTLYDYNIAKDCWLKVSLLTFNPFLNLLS